MPTTLDRTNITHTAQVRHLLDVAGTQWPDETPRSRMINLMRLGADVVTSRVPAAAAQARLAGLERLAAEIDADYGCQYEENYLDEVRAGWD